MRGRLLIRVRAAGAGYPDVMMAAGQFPLLGAPPFGLGEEAAGEVVAVPAGSRFAVGDQVAGITAFLEGWGGYAEYAYLREESSMRIPPGMTDAQAAGFPIAFRTAYAALVLRNYTVSGVLATPLEDPSAEAAVWFELVELATAATITTPVGTV